MAKRLTIAESSQIVLALYDEIRRSEDARYDHRLHIVLLVAQGLSCSEVSRLLGGSVRSAQNCVNAFEKYGLAGLKDKTRPGRPSRLTNEQMEEIGIALRASPEDYGLAGHLWDGNLLSEFISEKFGVNLKIRQCQRIFRQLGFRYRKPRPMIAGTEQSVKDVYKKTKRIDE